MKGGKKKIRRKKKRRKTKWRKWRGLGSGIGSDTVLAEKAAAATTITIEAGTNLREDATSTGEDIAMLIKVGPDPVSVSEIETERFRSWSVPVGPLLLVLFGVVTWVLGVVESLVDNAFWDGLEAVLDVSAWELVAPLETVLLRAVSEVLLVGTGMTMLALFLSVIFVCTYGIAQKHGAAKPLGRVFEWAVRAISGIGVVRWRAALAMTTTEGGVAFTPPIRITVVKWKELAVVLCRVEERGEVDGKEKSLPIEFVSAGDITPAVDMCPRHELGIGAGTRASGGGVGGSFGLGLFLLGFVVWGSRGKRLHRSRERR